MRKLSNSLLLFPVLALGIYLGSLSFLNLSLLIICFVPLAAIWLGLSYRGKKTLRSFFGLLVFLGALVVGQVSTISQQAWVEPKTGEFTSVVYSVRPLTYDKRLLVRLKPSRLQVAVHLPQRVEVKIGDELIFSGTISEPSKAPNPGVFCYKTYLKSQGVFGVCYPDEYSIIARSQSGILEGIRSWLRGNIVEHMREPGLVLALVLGEREQLGTEREEIWRELGISHLVAISGMHVGFVALGVGFLAQRLPLRSLTKLVLVQAVLFIYIIISGTGASGWRALLVSILGGYGSFIGARQDPLHMWATVGWILLLTKPSLIHDVGFTLSFAASGGIILWSPNFRIKCRSKTLTYLSNSLLISVIAQVSLAPFLLKHFGEIAILGPVATLVFLPLVMLLLIGGFLVALGLGPLGLGSLLDFVMNLIGALEHFLATYAWQITLRKVTLGEILLWWCLFIYAGWRFRQPRLTKPRRTIAHLVTILVVLLTVSSLPPVVRRPLEVTAVNVGQGDCFYIRTPSGLHLLVDGGGDSPYWQERGRNVGEERLVPYLQHRQVEKVDYVIVSHPHEDHLFGLLAVLENFEVGMVIDNGHAHTSPTYERYLDLLDQKNIPLYVARAGDVLHLSDGITLTVLYPHNLRPELPAAHNNNSLLLRLSYGGVRMLFTGDLEAPVLYDLAHDHNLDLSAQWLKVPHHGSRGSLVTEFYNKVDPSWAVIPVGPNSFGHPHSEVLDLLTQEKIDWRTTEQAPQTFQVWWGLWGRFKGEP